GEIVVEVVERRRGGHLSVGSTPLSAAPTPRAPRRTPVGLPDGVARGGSADTQRGQEGRADLTQIHQAEHRTRADGAATGGRGGGRGRNAAGRGGAGGPEHGRAGAVGPALRPCLETLAGQHPFGDADLLLA